MHIIIDGYNLIRQSDCLRQIEKKNGLEQGRLSLIRIAASYRQQKGHRITIVFDGWMGDSPVEHRDRMGGVDIFYSRRGEKADDLIKRLAEKPCEELVVVTSDRSIADHVTRRGGTAVPSPVFFAILENMGSLFTANTEAEKDERDEEPFRPGKRKGPSRRPSKKDRLASSRLKKL